jgi:hypothetical protein
VISSPSLRQTGGRGKRVFEQPSGGVSEVSRAYAAHDSERAHAALANAGLEVYLSAMTKISNRPFLTERTVFSRRCSKSQSASSSEIKEWVF